MNASRRQHDHLPLLKKLLSNYVPLSDAGWSAAKPCFTYKRYAAGAYVIEAGDRVRELGFILKGLARYYYLTPEGKEFNKSFAQTGQPLSSVTTLVTGEPSLFFIQALEPCECLCIHYHDLVTLSDEHRDWALLVRHLLVQLAIKKERREADFLLLSAQERYEKFLVEFAHVADRIANYHIASYLGITEVGLSRIRKRIGLIRR